MAMTAAVCACSLFYENPRYIMFIYMVINDALQLSLVTALYVLSYIFRMIHASVCCCLVDEPDEDPARRPGERPLTPLCCLSSRS